MSTDTDDDKILLPAEIATEFYNLTLTIYDGIAIAPEADLASEVDSQIQFRLGTMDAA